LPVDSLLTKICTSNNIDKNKIKLHVLKVSDINAFALPDNHLIVFSGLIETCQNESELAAVLAHEIAHMELKHIMKKLVAEVGISVLLSSSNDRIASAELTKEIAKMLSSSAYSRNMEKEADLKGVDYLINAEINPEGMADFFFMLSYFEPEATKQLAWVSSHAESGERAKYILEYTKTKEISVKPILSEQTWNRMKSRVSTN
jgi:predicted Zn-dependent protease